jgi:hypothetical protein
MTTSTPISGTRAHAVTAVRPLIRLGIFGNRGGGDGVSLCGDGVSR